MLALSIARNLQFTSRERCNSPEVLYLQKDRCDNLKSRTNKSCFSTSFPELTFSSPRSHYGPGISPVPRKMLTHSVLPVSYLMSSSHTHSHKFTFSFIFSMSALRSPPRQSPNHFFPVYHLAFSLHVTSLIFSF